MKMIIRKAKISDIDNIISICNELNIQRDSLEETGFVEYPTPAKKEWHKLLKASQHIYVASDGSKAIGFLSACPKKTLASSYFEKDQIVKKLAKKENYTYLDLIGIKKEYQSKKIGKKLLLRFLNDMKKEDFPIIGPIAIEPHINKVSMNMLTKEGFTPYKELTVYGGLKFRLYIKVIQ